MSKISVWTIATIKGKNVKKMTIKVLIISSLVVSPLCYAEVVSCTGKVNQLSNQVPNGFYMSVADSGNMQICNPEQDTFSVTPQNCKHIASLAALAYATGKDLTVTVENAPGANCSDITDDYDADISYVGIQQQ